MKEYINITIRDLDFWVNNKTTILDKYYESIYAKLRFGQSLYRRNLGLGVHTCAYVFSSSVSTNFDNLSYFIE